MDPIAILVVDDDPLARKVMAAQLAGHKVEFAEDAAAARKKLAAAKPDLCFIDLSLGDGDACSGLDVIPLAAKQGAYSVVMSGHDTEKYVERAYELGCDDFYSKGNEELDVRSVLARFKERRALSQDDRLFTERFVTQDPASQASIKEAMKYAPSELPILILGPSGTGKTRLAKLIHDRSGRAGEFVAINCSAYTEDLLEAELFGYRKGAFTGAGESRKGKLLLADRGTLFLDEIGSMSLGMQTKLLKAIEERQFYPLGSDRPELSRFRIVSATLEDLQALIKAGRMRFDFFQRVHGLTVELKSLSTRKGDILPLIAHLTRAGRKLAFAPDAKARLLEHPWPGNIRELKKFVDLLVAGHEGRVTRETVDRLLKTASAEAGADGFLTGEQYRLAKEQGLDAAVERFIDEAVARSLTENGGMKTKVLKDLGISTRLLYASLKRSGR